MYLPNDIIQVIASFVPVDYHLCCVLTCKTFKNIFKMPNAIHRTSFLYSRALTIYAYDKLYMFDKNTRYDMMNLAVSIGCVDVLDELTSVRFNNLDKTNPTLCATAAKHGKLDALMWLRENEYSWNLDVCSYASEHGHLNILQYAHTNGCESNIEECWNYAATSINKRVVQLSNELTEPTAHLNTTTKENKEYFENYMNIINYISEMRLLM